MYGEEQPFGTWKTVLYERARVRFHSTVSAFYKQETGTADKVTHPNFTSIQAPLLLRFWCAPNRVPI